MRLLAASICDFATVREGLLTIVSGGVTRMWRAELPGPMGVFLALQLEISAAERPFPHEVLADITGPDGTPVARIQGGIQVGAVQPGVAFDADETAVASMPFDLRPVGLPAYGWYKVAISADGVQLVELTFKVAPPPAAPAVPGVRIAPPPQRSH